MAVITIGRLRFVLVNGQKYSYGLGRRGMERESPIHKIAQPVNGNPLMSVAVIFIINTELG